MARLLFILLLAATVTAADTIPANGGDLIITDRLQGQTHGRVRRGFLSQRGQRQQRLMSEGSDRPEIAVMGRRDCEHRLRLSLHETVVLPFLTGPVTVP